MTADRRNELDAYPPPTIAQYLDVDTGFNEIVLDTGPIIQGFVSIYSTQSAVFCSAMIVDPTLIVPQGIDLHMVRFNAHRGTVE